MPPPGLDIHWENNYMMSFDEMEMDDIFDNNNMNEYYGSEHGELDKESNTLHSNSPIQSHFDDFSHRIPDLSNYDSTLDMPSQDEIASSIPVEITFIGRNDSSFMNAAQSLLELSTASRTSAGNPGSSQSTTTSDENMEAQTNRTIKNESKSNVLMGNVSSDWPKDKKVGLDNFKIIKVIGKGSFGKVFLVRDKLRGDIYAMKVLRKDNIIRRNQVEHTKTERNVLGYIRHPFIVGLNMAFQTTDKLFFVLDYCAGGELFFHLGKGKFSESRSRFYTAEIALALEHIHKLDIVYRDLKPENVLLDGEGHIRLTDFGLSKEGITENTKGAHSFCGTPEYLAPEILMRLGHGRAVDWWSLGALLYEMLTGLPPFYCRDREKLFDKIKRGQLNYPRYLTDASQSLLHGLLTKDPAFRLGSSKEDSSEVKRHIFFAPIDWEKMMKRELRPPWQPTVVGSVDTSQFDAEFTSMPIFSPSDRDLKHGMNLEKQPFDSSNVLSQSIGDRTFEGFTFVDKKRDFLVNHHIANENA
eukprot:CAMPEP_0171460982 /NCGR_PEP_ID=MMETSP0945-20130129/5626_1 /TAXON_ID=109269 /ORGANISM="Vaucheria litorea, Strain CCMP2940" /LENGTH=526 /DNA_ID=CAMNT_0011987265 /DNA_START=456 /DNA_END=2036 /DNA_ORIENTATION=-